MMSLASLIVYYPEQNLVQTFMSNQILESQTHISIISIISHHTVDGYEILLQLMVHIPLFIGFNHPFGGAGFRNPQ